MYFIPYKELNELINNCKFESMEKLFGFIDVGQQVLTIKKTIEKREKKWFLILLDNFPKRNYFTYEEVQLLRCACSEGNIEFLKILKARFLSSITDFHRFEQDGLMAAVESGRIEIVIYLTSEQLISRPKFWYEYSQLIHIAFSHNQMEMLKFLLDQGCNINYVDKDKWTVLYRAVRKAKTDFVKCLLEKKADPNLGSEDGLLFPLETAALDGNLEIVRLLLSNGAQPDLYCKWGNGSALVQATRGNYLEIIKALLEKGAKPDLLTYSGETALWIAAYNGNVAIARELLDHGANVNVTNNSTYDALSIAAAYGYLEVVQLLVERGVRIDRKNSDKRNAREIAINRKHTKVADFLSLVEERFQLLGIQ